MLNRPSSLLVGALVLLSSGAVSSQPATAKLRADTPGITVTPTGLRLLRRNELVGVTAVGPAARGYVTIRGELPIANAQPSELEPSALEAFGLDPAKLRATGVKIAGGAAAGGSALLLMSKNTSYAALAEALLPKGVSATSLEGIVTLIKNNPEAEAAVVGVTAAGISVVAIHAVAKDGSWLMDNLAWIGAAGLIAAFAVSRAWSLLTSARAEPTMSTAQTAKKPRRTRKKNTKEQEPDFDDRSG